MCTYLGAAACIDPEDVDADVVAGAEVTYLEGYLWDQPAAKDAIRQAAAAARGAGRQVALTLSDPFCVERHRDEFLELVADEIDILFANEDEICSLYEVDDFDDALQQVRRHCEIAALTRSAHGSVVIGGDEVHVIDAEPVDRWSTRPAPATCTRPASSTASPTATTSRRAGGSARSRRRGDLAPRCRGPRLSLAELGRAGARAAIG